MAPNVNWSRRRDESCGLGSRLNPETFASRCETSGCPTASREVPPGAPASRTIDNLTSRSHAAVETCLTRLPDDDIVGGGLGAEDLLVEECHVPGEDDHVMVHGLRQKLEYDDLASTPDDNRRYELLDGALFVTPSPRPLHQRVSKRLQRQLEAYFEDNGLGEVFNAPVDVILTLHDVVVPDLVVITTPPQVTERAIEGAPTIIVELLSPSTRMRDRKLKAERYAALGVPHYWIVDPARKTLECYRLERSRYAIVLTAESPARVAHPDWPALTVDLGAIWR